MKGVLSEVLRAARLWRIWVRLGAQDVRLRFRRSVIGIGWIFLNLIIMILAIGFVYGNLFGQDMHLFIPYLTISLVAWGYITNSIVEGGNAFVNSEGYIKQIGLPIYIYVFRYFVSVSLVALISLGVFFVVALIYNVTFTLGTLWVIPGLLLLMLASLMLITIFAHVNARFRDAVHLASVGMQMLLYVTPVIYPEELLRQRGLGLVIDLNPMFHLLQVIRTPILFGQAADATSYIVVGLAVILLTGVAATLIRVFGRNIVFAL